MSEPAIHIRREGPFYRVLVIPPDALPPSFSVPSTFVSAAVARMSAKVLSDATGWPVSDLAGAGG